MVILASLLFLSTPKDGRWTLNTGTKVSFIMIQPTKKLAWRPDGSPIDLKTVPKPAVPIWTDSTADLILAAVINPQHHEGDMPTVRLKLPATAILEAPFTLKTNNDLWVSGMYLHKQPSRQDVSVGIADGPWKTIGWVSYRKKDNLFASRASRGFNFDPDMKQISYTSGKDPKADAAMVSVGIVAKDHVRDAVFRLTAKDTTGHEMPSGGSIQMPGSERTIFYFRRNGTADLGRVEYQTRKCEWTTLWAAHFEPTNPSAEITPASGAASNSSATTR